MLGERAGVSETACGRVCVCVCVCGGGGSGGGGGRRNVHCLLVVIWMMYGKTIIESHARLIALFHKFAIHELVCEVS